MAGEAHQQRVAIGRGLGHRIRRQVAARAGFVFDHHRAAQLRAQHRGQRAGHGVGGAARRGAHQNFDGRLRLRLRGGHQPAQAQQHR